MSLSATAGKACTAKVWFGTCRAPSSGLANCVCSGCFARTRVVKECIAPLVLDPQYHCTRELQNPGSCMS
ncbi:hypothetical protein HBH53_102790 [Parastagonospora nodorum]|nr:hypothetical protein HBH53_102790 [Parastagonospora nodorum]KAH4057095.1 hypothetical protein HBH49_041610 [Parastagonospora nodorum]KAH4932758.1 hypothetical protein HBI79_093830 [Parastagonospora nodorum]KAH5083035.1 hypothetical protein HBH95_045290 [Parastagonospora nodorum]KAH5153170.1 hypothetical protein HBH69_127390 [Parastagonospora nodorum]